MTQANGHSHDNDTIESIRALTNQIQSAAVIERTPHNGQPFDQTAHDLMMESVDRVATHWIDELVNVRNNTKVIEQMVIEHATKMKNELTRLHLLGVQARREAQRSREVLERLGEELDAMMTGQARAA